MVRKRNHAVYTNFLVTILQLVDEDKEDNFCEGEDQTAQHPPVHHLDVGRAGQDSRQGHETGNITF